MPRRADPDPPLPLVVTAAEARAAGLTRDQVRQRVRSGRWTALARGAYRREVDATSAPSDLDDFAVARIDHAHRAAAAALTHPGCAVAFHSAAVIHGLPLCTPLPAHVALATPSGSWAGRRPGLVIHRIGLAQGDIIRSRVPRTSVARTWFDIARTLGLADGLAIGDAALRRGLVSSDELLRVMAHAEARRGVARARLAATHLDGARESAAESGSWAYFVRHRVALPRAQVEIRSRQGGCIARVDFWWDQARLVGECDGRLKYADRESLYREKRREDALRAEGYSVIRWGWSDLRGPDLAERLRRHLI